MQTQSVPYSIDINTCGGWYGMEFDVYIDFNQNGLFTDAGELVVNNTAAIQGPNTGFILIPATASLGSTRMRVHSVKDAQAQPELIHGAKQKIIVSTLLHPFLVQAHQIRVLHPFQLIQAV